MGFLSDNFIADGILIVLRWMFSFLKEYSLVIIVMTVAIRLILVPLDIRQKKNTRMMANIGPEVENLKKRYANNPDQLNKKTQELYRANKIKPMAGCLPAIIQLVLLFAYFGALRTLASEQTISVILNAANKGAANVSLPSWLWIHNIWQPDSGLATILPSSAEFMSFITQNAAKISPQTLLMLKNQGLISYSTGALTVVESAYTKLTEGIIAANGLTGFNNGWFGLPILAGVSMFFSQKLTMKNNPQMEGSKLMLWMFPIISLWICTTSNAIFAIYWFVSNICVIIVHVICEAIFNKQEQAAKPKPAAGVSS